MENQNRRVTTVSPGPGRHVQSTFNHEPDLPPPPPTPDKSGEPEPPPPSPPPPPPMAPIQPSGQMADAPPPPSPPPLVPNGNASGAPPPPPMPPLIINGVRDLVCLHIAKEWNVDFIFYPGSLKWLSFTNTVIIIQFLF